MNQEIQFLIEKDIVFKNIIDLYGVPEIKPSRPEGFETLLLLILEQQVSIDSAKATFLKLRQQIGKIIPQNFISVTPDEYKNAGVSRQKASYITCLANAIIDKKISLESFSSKSSEKIRDELIQIKGVGNWTIDVYLMFCLQKKDVFPIGDITLVNTLKELLGIDDKNQMIEYAKKWSPYRTTATYLLWHYYLKKRNRKITYQY